MKYTTRNTLETIGSLLIQFADSAPLYDFQIKEINSMKNIIESFKESGQIVEINGQLMRTDELADRNAMIRYMSEVNDTLDECMGNLKETVGNNEMSTSQKLHLTYMENQYIINKSTICMIQNPTKYARQVMKRLHLDEETPDLRNVLTDKEIVDFITETYRKKITYGLADLETYKMMLVYGMTDWLRMHSNMCKLHDCSLAFDVSDYNLPLMSTETMEIFECREVIWTYTIDDNNLNNIHFISTTGNHYSMYQVCVADMVRVIDMMRKIDDPDINSFRESYMNFNAYMAVLKYDTAENEDTRVNMMCELINGWFKTNRNRCRQEQDYNGYKRDILDISGIDHEFTSRNERKFRSEKIIHEQYSGLLYMSNDNSGFSDRHVPLQLLSLNDLSFITRYLMDYK